MEETFELMVTYNNQETEARLWADTDDERGMGIEVIWLVAIDFENGESAEILSISEYPQGSFTEIERDPNLTTPLATFENIISEDRN